MKYTLILPLALFALSCNKKANTETIKKTEQSSTKSAMVSNLVDPSNSANPFDYQGLNTKSLIESLLSSMESIDDQEERDNICRTYLVNNIQGSNAAEFINGVMSDDDLTREGFQAILEQNGRSSAYTNYALAMFDISTTSDGILYSDFKSSFINIENTIINDQKLATDESKSLLTMASCERFVYSTCIDIRTNEIMMPWMSRRIWRPLESGGIGGVGAGGAAGAAGSAIIRARKK